MGALHRAMDWHATPVGPVARWPQSLRTAVSIVLQTRFGMYIAWGADYTQFYNDGYRPILGSTKHPAVGLSARVTFAESWHIIGPLFDQVMRGEAVGADDWMLPLDRHGYLEECYFIFSYSPIREESGGVGGVLVTVTESTARVLGERRLRTLRDLAERAADGTTPDDAWTAAREVLAQNPSDVPFALLYELDPDGRAARRVGAAGLAVDHPAAPARIVLDAPDAPWPLAAVVSAGAAQPVTDVRARHGDLPGGPWPEAPEQAVVLPVARAGSTQPFGFIVAGVSPRRALDAAYREFHTMLAAQIATALANAHNREAERQRALALAALDQAKTDFFSNVSHEFRTPLTLVLGPTEDALASPARALAGEDLVAVHRNALRLLKLVNAVLDFSRIEAGRVQAAFEPVDLAQVTTDLAGAFRSTFERAGLSLAVTAGPLPEAVYVDREMWEKIVLNLLSNAFKFTFKGGAEVGLRTAGGRVELSIADTGTGIPEGEIPHLFERFHRVKGARSRSYEGSGIGLALVHELVRLHGGTIRVDSAVDRGTTFTVSLPVGRAHLPAERVVGPRAVGSSAALFVDEARRWLSGAEVRDSSVPLMSVPPSAATALVHTAGARPARVLVADDNADMRDYLARLLATRFEVDAAPDGAAALAVASVHPPDLVLADVMMPGLDGFALMNALRREERTRAVPVILVSARAGEEARMEGLEAGADDYLVKPFAARELLARVALHLELSRARAAAEAQRAHLHGLFMQAPVAICTLRGADLVFELVNPLYQRILGRDRRLAGLPIRTALPELAGQGFFELLERVYTTGVPYVGREVPAMLDQNGDGQLVECLFDFVYHPMTAVDGNVEGVMACAIDVTEQVRARLRVEEANRAKDEFLATVSHELRTPLTAILGWTRMLLAGVVSEEKRARALETVDRNARAQVQLVEDILDFSRITSGKLRLNIAAVAMAHAVEMAVESVRPAADARGVRLQVVLEPHSGTVMGDLDRLQQVCWNLLSNAVKFTPRGGRVFVSVRRVDSRVELTVADTGRGIAPEFLPHVFERFRQGEAGADRQHGGLGLGLAIVKHLVEQHGGQITAFSAGLGHGAQFTVGIPIAPVRTTAVPEPAEPAEGEFGVGGLECPPSLAGLAVLVVDDEPDARELVASVLTHCKARVVTAASVPEALAVFDGEPIDVLVSDIGMPGQTGYDLIREVRARPPVQGRPLAAVALTAYARSDDRTRALRAGFNSHVAKPVEPAELLVVIASLVERFAAS